MAVTTKRYILNEAFDEIGLASYAFNLSANDLMAALRKMDALVASWEAQGLTFGWLFSTDPNGSDPDDPITVPDAALQPLTAGTSIRLSPSNGKIPSVETKIAYISGLNALRNALRHIPQQQYPNTLPIGTGNRWPYVTYFQEGTSLDANGNEVEL